MRHGIRRIRRNASLSNSRIAIALKQGPQVAADLVFAYFKAGWAQALDTETHVMAGPGLVNKHKGWKRLTGWRNIVYGLEGKPYPMDQKMTYRQAFETIGKEGVDIITMSDRKMFAKARKNDNGKIVLTPVDAFDSEFRAFLETIMEQDPIRGAYHRGGKWGGLGIIKLLASAGRGKKSTDWRALVDVRERGQSLKGGESFTFSSKNQSGQGYVLKGVPALNMMMATYDLRIDLLQNLKKTVNLTPVGIKWADAKIATLKKQKESYRVEPYTEGSAYQEDKHKRGRQLRGQEVEIDQSIFEDDDVFADMTSSTTRKPPKMERVHEEVRVETSEPSYAQSPTQTEKMVDVAAKGIAQETGASVKKVKMRIINRLMEDDTFVYELRKICALLQP